MLLDTVLWHSALSCCLQCWHSTLQQLFQSQLPHLWSHFLLRYLGKQQRMVQLLESLSPTWETGEALDSWFQLLRSCRGTNQQMQQLFLLSPDCHCSFQIKTCGFLFVWRTSTVLQLLLFIEPFPSTNKKMRFHGLQVASHSPTSCWTHREAPPTALATGRGQRKAGWGPSLCHSRPSRGKNSPEEKNRFLT